MIKIFLNTITKDIFNFKTRSSRKEYFIFLIFELLIIGPLLLAKYKYGPTDLLTIIAGVVLIIYLFANSSLVVRRLHDSNLSGWWFLLSIVFSPFVWLILFLFKGTEGANRYGEPPE